MKSYVINYLLSQKNKNIRFHSFWMAIFWFFLGHFGTLHVLAYVLVFGGAVLKNNGRIDQLFGTVAAQHGSSHLIERVPLHYRVLPKNLQVLRWNFVYIFGHIFVVIWVRGLSQAADLNSGHFDGFEAGIFAVLLGTEGGLGFTWSVFLTLFTILLQ